MTEQLNVQQMAQRLMTADNILILCHKNPDGDTIGCGSALYCALKALDKNVAVLCSDAIPNRYAFTNAHMFKGEFEPQTVVAVDVASVQLFGENNGMTQFSRHVDLCIDHHAGNNGYADFTLLDAGAAAAAELLYQVIAEMGVTITPHIADCLYTGIATDTGCFKYSNTTSRTHIIAAKLMAYEFDVSGINYKLFDMKSKGRLELEQAITQGMEFFCDDRVAVVWLTTELMDRFMGRVDSEDFNGLASLPRQVEGVIIGATVKQKGPATFKISVRTAEPINAGSVCALFGGGGHARAAGCTIEGSIEFVKAKLLPVFEKALKANE